jgi:hypothetical protein
MKERQQILTSSLIPQPSSLLTKSLIPSKDESLLTKSLIPEEVPLSSLFTLHSSLFTFTLRNY